MTFMDTIRELFLVELPQEVFLGNTEQIETICQFPGRLSWYS
jgi:hypothetical protein